METKEQLPHSSAWFQWEKALFSRWICHFQTK